MVDRISLPGAIAIGIGGMIGAGIFSVLGVIAETAGSGMWISFLLAGIVALFCTYSYAKLGVKYPTAGGAVEFLVRGFGVGTISGGINLFLWIGYVLAIALYAQGFAAYFMTFFDTTPASWVSKLVAVASVLFFTIVNLLGAGSVGKAEFFIVLVKVIILVMFSLIGLFFVRGSLLSPIHWHDAGIFYGAGILFIGYEGFGLITNAAANLKNPERQLPIALYTSVILVMIIYLLVSITVAGNLSIAEINVTKDYALAQAAKPFLGMFGFKLMAIAALFSTSSAINATLFGGANVSYMIARDGELPAVFSRTEWRQATGGLLITTALVISFIIFFDLARIAMMGSGSFLLIYAAVNLAHLNVLERTGANKTIVVMSLLLCLLMFIVLEYYTYQQSPLTVYTMFFLLGGCFLGEAIYRKFQPHP